VSWAIDPFQHVAEVGSNGSLTVEAPNVSNGTTSHITISSTITSIFAIVSGLIFCYFGHKFFKVTIFIAGFYIFALAGWLLLINVEPQTGYGPSAEWIFLGVCLALGLIGGTLFVCLWTFGIACIGAIGGFFLALFILSFNDNGFITNHISRSVVILIAVIIGVVLSFFLDRHIVIFGTSASGAYVVTLGLDGFAHTDFSASTRKFLDGNHQIIYNITPAVIGMMVAFLFLFITGTIFQYRYHKAPFHPDGRHYERTHEKA